MDKWYIESRQPTLFGKNPIIWFWTKDFYVEEISRDLANKIIVENHYSKKFYNATYIHLWVFIDKELIWVLQYWYAMNPASQSSVVKDTEQDEYLELNRMWLDDVAPKNSESQAIWYSIKYIKRKYKKIKWIQSFADERCWCYGIVYQACNFLFYGEHLSKFWELDWETFHNSIMTSEKAWPRWYNLLNHPDNKDRVIKHELRQFRYIYFIKKWQKEKCLLKEKKYLKYYNND